MKKPWEQGWAWGAIALPLLAGAMLTQHSSARASSNLDAVQQLLETNACVGCNLEEVNLHEADLRGADLRGANLVGSNLYRTNLEGALLTGANLEEAYLGYANLSGADLSATNLSHAKIYYTQMVGTNLQAADVHRTWIESSNLQFANLLDTNFSKAIVVSADLRNALICGATMMNDQQFAYRCPQPAVPEILVEDNLE